MEEAFHDSVLLDNTTLYGAMNAFDTWPPKSDDWFDEQNSVNIRSLMDVLETIVLQERILVDTSCGNPPQLAQLNFMTDRIPFATSENMISLLVGVSLEKLQTYLGDGTFSKGLERFRKPHTERILPKFYSSPADFGELLKEAFPIDFTPEIDRQLTKVKTNLQASSPGISNYAMFVFRGFYYQQLAHLHSLSYIPHTWRSDILEIDINKSNIDFAKYINKEARNIRQELTKRLNDEFNTTAFTDDYPIFASYIASQCNNRSQLLSTAIEVRNSSSARAFRKWISNIQTNVQNQSDLQKIYRAQAELKTIIADLRKEFGLSIDTKTKTEPIKIRFGIPIVGIEGIPIHLSIPNWLQAIFHRRTHLVFLRKIMEKSVSFSPFLIRYQQLLP